MSLITFLSFTLLFVSQIVKMNSIMQSSSFLDQHDSDVAGDSIISSLPSPSVTSNITISPSSSTTIGQSNIQVSIKNGMTSIETKGTSANISVKNLIYPDAEKIGEGKYQVNVSGSSVYDWYKNEFEKQGYNTTTKVKTQANDLFKGVLAGANSSNSLKITIDQETKSSFTYITIE
jgi:hypothetical protein